MEISAHPATAPEGARFSILIPTWNNLEMLKLCIRGLREHSRYPHEFIIHVNEGSDGTLDWVKEEGIPHTFSKENVGVCHALNASAELATTDMICFLNDDMFVLPDWDHSLLEVIEALPHRLWFLSGTMVEPGETGNLCAIQGKHYGANAEDFKEDELLRDYGSWPLADWSGATWPPNVVPRELWESVGGYSEEFSPGMSSDPDFSMKLWQKGVRHFQGVAASRVYHFQAKSTGKVTKNDGPRQFLQKWALTQGAFGRLYLRRGRPWKGPLPEPGPKWKLALERWRAKRKIRQAAVSGDGIDL